MLPPDATTQDLTIMGTNNPNSQCPGIVFPELFWAYYSNLPIALQRSFRR